MDWVAALAEKLKTRAPGIPLEENVLMSRMTSFRIGGPARLVALPRSGEELSEAFRCAREMDIDPLPVGNGTNLLVPDRGLDAFVIRTFDGVGDIRCTGEAEISAGAGVLLSRLASFARDCGLAGLEFAHGIPGTLGGAVVMNAGAYGGEMKDAVYEVRALSETGELMTLREGELDFSYRHSVFSGGGGVVLGAVLRLAPGDTEGIRGKMEELSARRRQSQPLEYPSAGSAFKRPPGHFAAALIQEAGLKGTAVGGAQVSEKHAGFIINRGGATCEDVLRLMDLVRETVFRRSGVTLEPEIKILDGTDLDHPPAAGR
ncbi:UDP-N-acetylmuramate dehydrogenase [Papillibacter cinnamivorans]|uniref:UDP-N-acetylenolpyruvoylglucosamine reductase n=1 Tax=Papillibacter cinnamivorans DSM 12816 TaxID=1122930 RepID=A0A1W1YMK3_9FIRM|nr:UDP-N-acetylmuramate dehydrogenase [Papillibacter cinnamivorans]SMC37435.1 UDP-N-acetylmuramate dehydrogenase [Papillibacter cinnamivorans DSM 12816]